MRRKASIILMLTMLISILASCSDNVSTSDSTSNSPSANTEDAPSVLVFANVDDGFSQYEDAPDTKRVHDKFVEEINVDLQPVFFPGDQYVNRVNLMLTTNDQLDIITRAIGGNFSRPDVKKWIDDGIIIELTDLIEKMPNYIAACESNELVKTSREQLKMLGKDYGIPYTLGIQHTETLKIRADWLENLGMDTPETIEDFETYLEAVKTQDPDGNGADDTYGICGDVWDGNIFSVLATAYLPAGDNWWLDETGTLQHPGLHSGYQELLSKLVEWQEKGYLPPDALLSDDDQRLDWITNNQLGAVAGWYSATVGGTVTLQEKLPEVAWKPIVLSGREDAANAAINSLVSAHGNVVTSTCKDLDAVARYYDYLWSEEGMMLAYYGIEGEHYDIGDTAPVFRVDDNDTPLYKAYYYPMLNTSLITSYGEWPGSDPTSALYRQFTEECNSLPGVDKPDALVLYDYETMTGGELKTDLDTYINENRAKVLAGEIPSEDWGSIMQTWLEKGGEEFTKGMNETYQAWLAENS